MEHLWVNGISFRVAQTGPSDAPAVVLSNSLAADLSMWEPQAQALARDFRVIRMDMRGHGGSDAPAGDYSLNQLADDVLGVMDELGVPRAHFVGLSLGGMVGQILGARPDCRFDSLTLCATFGEAPRQLWADRVEAVLTSGVGPMVEGTIGRWFTPEFASAAPEVISAVRRMIGATSMNGYAGCAAAIRDMDLTGVPERIKVPTLVIAASDDPSAPPAAMKQLHQRIPHARYAEIAHAAHLFTLEKPDEASALILAFLKSVQSHAGQTSAGLKV